LSPGDCLSSTPGRRTSRDRTSPGASSDSLPRLQSTKRGRSLRALLHRQSGSILARPQTTLERGPGGLRLKIR
jgi:hypothetical protein